jgi:hypothetical protein
MKSALRHEGGAEAQLKHRANAHVKCNREGGVHTEAEDEANEMLGRAKFWYSQLNLIHAIALHEACASPLPKSRKVPSVSARLEEALKHRKPHPFVEAAAKLCDRGLGEVVSSCERSRVKEYVWEDESKLVSGDPGVPLVVPNAASGWSGRLVDPAIQLVGDIILLLNMNEKGKSKARIEFAETNRLPYCLARSTDRRELLRGCNEACGFGLCPYQPVLGLSAHREISHAFCAHQKRNATARTANKHWKSRVKQGPLSDLWHELEVKSGI